MVWFPVLHVGWLVTVQVRVLEFLFNEVDCKKKKIIVVHVNGTHWKKESAVMVKANIVQIYLDTKINLKLTFLSL